MRNHLIAIMACAIIMPASLALADRATEDAQTATAATNVYSSNQAVLEDKVLRQAEGRAERRGNTLVLALENGKPIKLVNHDCNDVPRDVSQCKWYYLQADLKSRHAYIVMIAYYEGWDTLWIDSRTGKQTSLDAPPIFGPDGRTFLVLNSDEENGQEFQVSLWTAGPDQPTLIWGERGRHYGETVNLVHWRTADKIELEVVPFDVSGKPGVHQEMDLLREARSWRLKAKPLGN